MCFKETTVIGKIEKGRQKNWTRGQNNIVNKMRLKDSRTLPNLQALAASNVSHLDLLYNNDLLYNHNEIYYIWPTVKVIMARHGSSKYSTMPTLPYVDCLHSDCRFLVDELMCGN